MTMFKAFLRKLVRGLLMKAAYWTAMGAMLVPIGVLLVVEVPSLSQLAFWLIVAGLVSVITGWVYTIVEENQRREKERLGLEEDKLIRKQRRRESRAHLLVLSEIAKKQGVSMVKVNRMLQRWVDEESEAKLRREKAMRAACEGVPTGVLATINLKDLLGKHKGG